MNDSLLKAQRNEISEYFIYTRLANRINNKQNKKILVQIANDELNHYNILKRYTGQDVSPNYIRVWFYYIICLIFGITFGLKLMEKGEEHAQIDYRKLSGKDKAIKKLFKDEQEHENKLLAMLDEEKLKYVGSIVLGLNDALVELTGALAGLTLALQNTKLIALVGLVTGIAASLSMAASEYLSTKSEKNSSKSPIRAAVYTGIAYIFTVGLLIVPYLLFNNYFIALLATLINAVLIVLVFTYYISVAEDKNFKKEFVEMVAISLSVAVVSFGIGYLVRFFFNVDV